MSFKLQFHLIKRFQAVGAGNIVIRNLTSETDWLKLLANFTLLVRKFWLWLSV